ncbi:MAG: LysE family translocator [Desulfobacteraceae bacterium]|jgi:threonine/homoserine/homoserine lactone efflux protein
MFEIQNFSLFIISSILLNLTPGQDTIYIIGRSVVQGKKGGMVSAFGIMSGVLVHTMLAAFGLSAILVASSIAFSIVKYIGAGYLIWIGIGFVRNKAHHAQLSIDGSIQQKPWKTYRQGMLTNLLNPKVALFFLSFLPQFVSPETESVFGSFMALGMIFFMTGSIWCIVLVYGSSWLKSKFYGGNMMGGLLNKITGALFIGLGIKLAFSQR